jgi:hypothetical protein
MRKADRDCFLRLIASVSIALCSMQVIIDTASAAPDTSGTTITFSARGTELNPANLVGSNAHDISASHIFMIISHPTAHGPKEDAYGFYPMQDGIGGLIKGPGMLKPEYRCNPTDDCNPGEYKKSLLRPSETELSVKVPVTDEQVRAVLERVEVWDLKQFSLVGTGVSGRDQANCIDFIADVAQSLGYPPPAHDRFELPATYMRALKSSIEAEDERRAIRQTEEAAERERQRQERMADEERRNREQLAEQERLKHVVPPGWVRCSCPGAHASFGRYVDGAFYHPTGPRCP